MKTALFTGSFDPVTKGHLDLIKRSSEIFSNVIVAVGDNPKKNYLFSKEKRTEFVLRNVSNLKNVSVIPMPNGKLSSDMAYEHDAVIIKGVRINADFDYEKMMHEINHIHNKGVDTMIFPCQSEYNHISSTATKEICKLCGNTEDFVTLDVKFELEKVLNKQKRIVLTGSIGSGKSTIMYHLDKCFDERVHNIDMDVIARDILFYRNEPVYVKLRKYLQNRFDLSVWDRKSVGDSVFSKKENRLILNESIRQPMLTRIREELQGKEGIIVFNGALMIESGWTNLGNNNVAVLHVSDEIQKERLKQRGYTSEQIETRLGAQLNTQSKIDKLQEVIDKDGYGRYDTFITTNLKPESTAYSISEWIRNLK